MPDDSTIARYLVTRLEQLGLKHLFGVPGDYSMPFMDVVLDSSIRLVGNCNELNAGYAADGYARISGLGALVVTYNVGSFSAYNAIGGAYAERVPVVLIAGAPKVAEARQHLLMHHLVTDYAHEREIYERVTVAAVSLDDPARAPALIDDALTKCIELGRPVFIEIPIDRVDTPCRAPSPGFAPVPRASDPDALAESVQEVAGLLRSASAPAVLAGSAIDRHGLRGALHRLLDGQGYRAAVTLDAVGTVPPSHPSYCGIYQGHLGTGDARTTIESADRLLVLGAMYTDITSAGFSAKIDRGRMISAHADSLRIGRHTYPEVYLHDFLPALVQVMAPATGAMTWTPPAVAPYAPVADRRITSDRLFARVKGLLGPGTVVVSDTGDAFFQTTLLPNVDRYIAQSYYLSIGYALPAALGVALAAPQARTILVIGDGAFQMTAQELSTIVRYRVPVLIFLLNNDGYVIERMLHHEAAYNDINRWRYAELARVFGDCPSVRVETEGELDAALATADAHKDGPVFIEVFLERNDVSAALKNIVAMKT